MVSPLRMAEDWLVGPEVTTWSFHCEDLCQLTHRTGDHGVQPLVPRVANTIVSQSTPISHWEYCDTFLTCSPAVSSPWRSRSDSLEIWVPSCDFSVPNSPLLPNSLRVRANLLHWRPGLRVQGPTSYLPALPFLAPCQPPAPLASSLCLEPAKHASLPGLRMDSSFVWNTLPQRVAGSRYAFY